MTAKAKADARFVALLRGINVGGKNSLPMKALAELFEAAGARDVRTYIQSGNVVFRAGEARVGALCDAVSRAISKSFGLEIPLVLRSAADFARVAAAHPLSSGADPKTLHVAFLAEVPAPAQVRSLDPERSPPDRFVVRGRELYLCCPNGIAKTKLTNAYLDRVLGTTSTLRNWATVQKLRSMLDA